MQKLSAQILKLSDQLMPYLQDVPTPWGDAGTKAFEAAKVSERRANHLTRLQKKKKKKAFSNTESYTT